MLVYDYKLILILICLQLVENSFRNVIYPFNSRVDGGLKSGCVTSHKYLSGSTLIISELVSKEIKFTFFFSSLTL